MVKASIIWFRNIRIGPGLITNMKIQLNIFWREALMFGLTLALGLFVASQNINLIPDIEIVQPSMITAGDLMWFIIIFAGIWLISRIRLLASWLFWIFISLLIFSGSQIVIASIAPFPADIIVSLLVLVAFLVFRKVIVHDAAMILAVAGLGAALGVIITPSVGILVLILLSFYDIIAVYKTKHMVHMVESMIRSGAVFGFIIPSSSELFLASRREVKSRIGTDFTILGSGDIGLPVIFVSSLIRQSLPEAIIVACFVMLGLLLTHVLFVSQSERRPMAALPPIATMTLIGYAVALAVI